MFKVQSSKPANPKVQYSIFNVQSQSPYMLVMDLLMCKMVEMKGYANACRDARSVRPRNNLRAFAQVISMDFTERAAFFAFLPFYFYPLSFSLFFHFPFILFQIIVLTLQENVGSCTMICCN